MTKSSSQAAHRCSQLTGIFITVLFFAISVASLAHTEIKLDSAKNKSPLYGLRGNILLPQIIDLPFFYSANYVNSDGTLSDSKIHNMYNTKAPKIHYTLGAFIKKGKHTGFADMIFRPQVYGGGKPIQTHPTKYHFFNLSEYALAGFSFQYAYELCNKKKIKNDIAIGGASYSYRTKGGFSKYNNTYKSNSFIYTISNIFHYKLNKKFVLTAESQIAFGTFNYSAISGTGLTYNKIKGKENYFNLKTGILFLINSK